MGWKALPTPQLWGHWAKAPISLKNDQTRQSLIFICTRASILCLAGRETLGWSRSSIYEQSSTLALENVMFVHHVFFSYQVVTNWKPSGHQMVTKWSTHNVDKNVFAKEVQAKLSGHHVVTTWSPNGCHLGTLPHHLGTLPDQLGILPDHLGTIPDHLGTIPDHFRTLPDHLGTLPDNLGTVLDYLVTILDHLYLPHTVSNCPKQWKIEFAARSE